jgi:hypothetical protein
MNEPPIRLEYADCYVEQELQDVVWMLRQQQERAGRPLAAELRETEASLRAWPSREKAVFDGQHPLFWHLHRASCALLQERKGTLYCHRCSRHSLAGNLIFERFERGWPEVPLMGGGGRRFYCGNEHLLVSITDWVS